MCVYSLTQIRGTVCNSDPPLEKQASQPGSLDNWRNSSYQMFETNKKKNFFKKLMLKIGHRLTIFRCVKPKASAQTAIVSSRCRSAIVALWSRQQDSEKPVKCQQQRSSSKTQQKASEEPAAPEQQHNTASACSEREEMHCGIACVWRAASSQN